MTRNVGYLGLAGLVLAVLCTGCIPPRVAEFIGDENQRHANAVANSMAIEQPSQQMGVHPELVSYNEPVTIKRQGPPQYWDLTLQEVVHLALANSQVMRDVNGRVLNAPGSAPSIYDPALQELDPRFGLQRALAAFDASFTTSLFLARNERTFNNSFFGGGTNNYEQNTAEFNAELSKTSATGTRFFIRNIINYDRNNSPNNLFRSGYDEVIEAEIRHPFLQGGGLEYNRIIGPNGQLGNFNGVVIARINSDIALTDFEIAVRQLITDVERTYWGLYLAYRELDSVIEGRDNTLKIWERVRALVEEKSSRAEREALVREQYYDAQQQVENILNGSPIQGATQQLYNPVTAINAGVLGTERRLRFLMGVPNTDGRLIRPLDEPALVHQVFDFDEALSMALTRRVELRRQKWAITRREMELVGTRNFLMGRLDMVAKFGVRGFGDQLFGDDGTPLHSAFQDLFMNRLQQWQIGMQYQTVIGNRTGYAAVRQAELQLMRERALYRDQEMQVASEVGGAFAELERSYSVSKLAFNRRIAAQQNLEPIFIRFQAVGEQDKTDSPVRIGVSLEFLLDAQRRSTQAEVQFYRAVVDHTMAVSIMHYYRGTYLDYHNVHLAEGPWTAAAHESADREARRFLLRRHLETKVVPCPVSDGEFAQGADALPETVPTPPAEGTLPAPAAPTPTDPKVPESVPSEPSTPPQTLLLPPVPVEPFLSPESKVLPSKTQPAPAELPAPGRMQKLPADAASVRQTSAEGPTSGHSAPNAVEGIATAGQEATDGKSTASRIPVISQLWGPQPAAPALRSTDPPKAAPAVRNWPFALPRMPKFPTIWPQTNSETREVAPVVAPEQARKSAAEAMPKSFTPNLTSSQDGHSQPFGEARVTPLPLKPMFDGHSTPSDESPAGLKPMPAPRTLELTPPSNAAPGNSLPLVLTPDREATSEPSPTLPMETTQPALAAPAEIQPEAPAAAPMLPTAATPAGAMPSAFPTGRPIRRMSVNAASVPSATIPSIPSAATFAPPPAAIPATLPPPMSTLTPKFAPMWVAPPSSDSTVSPPTDAAAAPAASATPAPEASRGPRRVRINP